MSKKTKSLFNRGYEASREEKKRQDKAREANGKRLYNLYIANDGDEAQVRFLTDEPVNFYAHNVRTFRDGKERFDMHVCSQDDDCPYCEDGDNPSYKAAFLVLDRREYKVEDKKTGKKKTVRGTIRLYIQGVRIVSQLDRISSKYGLTKCDITIARVGNGQNTTYTFDRMPEENEKITKKEIESYLPEKIRDMFDGSQESLYRIIEEQLKLMLPNSNGSDNDDDEDDEDDEDERENERKRRSKLVSYDDEDEDEDDDEEEEPPRKKSKPSVKKRTPSRYDEDEDEDDEDEDEPPKKKKPLSGKKKPSLFKRK